MGLIVGYDWRARIGYITPSDTLETPAYEFYQVAPDGVVLVGACLSVNRLEGGALEAALKQLDSTAKSVAEYSVDVLVVGGAPLVYMTEGVDETEIGGRLSELIQRPVFSEVAATLAALETLEARKVAVVTPFEQSMNDRLASFLSRRGLQVTGIVGGHKGSNAEITRMSVSDSYRYAIEAYRQSSERPDAIYITCPRWPVMPNIRRLEEDLGIPVVASVQSWLWYALRTLGLQAPISDIGYLGTIPKVKSGSAMQAKGTK